VFYKIITDQNRNMDFMPESETVLEIKIPSSPASGLTVSHCNGILYFTSITVLEHM
jgi:hypothetical protein